MSNSPLVSYTKISSNSTNPRRGKISKITIHHMAGNLTIEQCGIGFSSKSRKASANYGVGTDGRIGSTAPSAPSPSPTKPSSSHTIFLSFMIFSLQAFLFTNTLDAVPNDQYRVAEQHTRSGIPHNSTDFFPHGGLIAMHPAVGAKGLCFDKRAAVGAQQRILLQGLTFRAKPLPCAVASSAVGAYHQ